VKKTLIAACLLLATLTALAAPAQAPTLIVKNAWARKAPGTDVAAVYLSLSNTSLKPIIVIGIRSSIANDVMIHETSVAGGQSQMRMKDKVVIAPGQTLNFAPGGLHIMLSGLKGDLAVGKAVPLILLTADGVQVAVAAVVKPLGTQ
jgi:copper(I)-binding protein